MELCLWHVVNLEDKLESQRRNKVAVLAAIMDCSQNPMNIAKYQNDKEVMDVFNKISELFPGASGSPFHLFAAACWFNIIPAFPDEQIDLVTPP